MKNIKIPQNILEFIPQILDQAKNGISITDPNLDDNPLVYVNDAFCSLFEYEAQEVLGKNCRFLQLDDRNQSGINLIKKAIQNKKSTTVVLRNYSKSRKLIYNEVTLSPIFNDNGELKFFLGVQKDVTREHELLKKLRSIV